MVNDILSAAMSYTSYRELLEILVSSGRTTGINQSENLLEFTKLNVHRMNRLDKTIVVDEEMKATLSALKKPLIWLVLGEAWCGDCAQIIPILNKVAETSQGKIDLRIISKDTFPELIETYHTNGAKAIPKMLVIDEESRNIISTWGPRPQPAQQIMLNWKVNKDKISWEDFEKELHSWYAKDKGKTTVYELNSILKNLLK